MKIQHFFFNVCALLCGLLVSQQTVRGEVRELTDMQGRSIRAEVKQVKGDDVTIEREDGRSFTIGISRFTDPSLPVAS